jgi:dTDP-L-rhamnose 4-epimerase
VVTPRRVLVTGGAGFIGSHVVRALVGAGIEVTVVDREPPAPDVAADLELPDGARFVRADLNDVDRLEAEVRGVDGVSHQASMVGLGVDLGDVTGYVRDNDLGTASLLLAMHRAGFRGPLVVASSMVVYGEGTYRCARHGPVRPPPRSAEDLEAGRFEPCCPSCRDALVPGSVTEDAPFDPRNVYAATKVHQEHLCAVWARETGASVTALRYHNVYGPGMPADTPYAGVASIFRSALQRGRAPEVFEDGRQRRDFVHVADVARANLLALGAGLTGAFNVASGHPRSIGDLAWALRRGAAPGTPEPRTTGRFRLGDVRHVVASPGRARRELGFRARVHPDAGLPRFATEPMRTAGEPRPAPGRIP